MHKPSWFSNDGGASKERKENVWTTFVVVFLSVFVLFNLSMWAYNDAFDDQKHDAFSSSAWDSLKDIDDLNLLQDLLTKDFDRSKGWEDQEKATFALKLNKNKEFWNYVSSNSDKEHCKKMAFGFDNKCDSSRAEAATMNIGSINPLNLFYVICGTLFFSMYFWMIRYFAKDEDKDGLINKIGISLLCVLIFLFFACLINLLVLSSTLVWYIVGVFFLGILCLISMFIESWLSGHFKETGNIRISKIAVVVALLMMIFILFLNHQFKDDSMLPVTVMLGVALVGFIYLMVKELEAPEMSLFLGLALVYMTCFFAYKGFSLKAIPWMGGVSLLYMGFKVWNRKEVNKKDQKEVNQKEVALKEYFENWGNKKDLIFFSLLSLVPLFLTGSGPWASKDLMEGYWFPLLGISLGASALLKLVFKFLELIKSKDQLSRTRIFKKEWTFLTWVIFFNVFFGWYVISSGFMIDSEYQFRPVLQSSWNQVNKEEKNKKYENYDALCNEHHPYVSFFIFPWKGLDQTINATKEIMEMQSIPVNNGLVNSKYGKRHYFGFYEPLGQGSVDHFMYDFNKKTCANKDKYAKFKEVFVKYENVLPEMNQLALNKSETPVFNIIDGKTETENKKVALSDWIIKYFDIPKKQKQGDATELMNQKEYVDKLYLMRNLFNEWIYLNEESSKNKFQETETRIKNRWINELLLMSPSKDKIDHGWLKSEIERWVKIYENHFFQDYAFNQDEKIQEQWLNAPSQFHDLKIDIHKNIAFKGAGIDHFDFGHQNDELKQWFDSYDDPFHNYMESINEVTQLKMNSIYNEIFKSYENDYDQNFATTPNRIRFLMMINHMDKYQIWETMDRDLKNSLVGFYNEKIDTWIKFYRYALCLLLYIMILGVCNFNELSMDEMERRFNDQSIKSDGWFFEILILMFLLLLLFLVSWVLVLLIPLLLVSLFLLLVFS